MSEKIGLSVKITPEEYDRFKELIEFRKNIEEKKVAVFSTVSQLKPFEVRHIEFQYYYFESPDKYFTDKMRELEEYAIQAKNELANYKKLYNTLYDNYQMYTDIHEKLKSKWYVRLFSKFSK